MMRRRTFLAGLAAFYAAAARAQTGAKTGKPARIGVLRSGPAEEKLFQEFVAVLREMGWFEGRDVIYERVAIEGQGRMPEAAAALIGKSPTVIVARGGPEALAFIPRTRTIPIVFWAANDPIQRGIVSSLPRPGGNATGIANIGWELGGKRMQLLMEALPSVDRVG
ncbi:MAG: ABC transporter substrate binding protein, partial [Betaproteobacteria bacterium]